MTTQAIATPMPLPRPGFLSGSGVGVGAGAGAGAGAGCWATGCRIVCPALLGTASGAPQFVQNFAPSGCCLPQFVQNMLSL